MPSPNPFFAFDSAITRIRERTKARTKVFDRDALLPDDAPEHNGTTTMAWSQVSTSWANIIQREQLQDFTLENWRTMAVDPRDGAITRGAGGLAVTPHAWGQLVSLLLQRVPGRPSGVGSVDGWHVPYARALGFDDCLMRSRRNDSDEMHARTFRDSHSGLVALRAVVSGRHAFTLFDDLAVMARLNLLLPPGAPARVNRSTNETNGYALLQEQGTSAALDKLQPALYWRNSETGCARISFTGGVSLRFLDRVLIRGTDAVGLSPDEVPELEDGDRVTERTISLVDRSTRTARNHTAPRKVGTRVLTPAERAAIANARMDKDIKEAVSFAQVMMSRWAEAVKEMAPGWDEGLTGALAFDVLLDVAEETRGFAGEDRAALLKVLTDEKRLSELPCGSAAHMAAAYAVLAATVAQAKEARRLQSVAGEWLMKGWRR